MPKNIFSFKDDPPIIAYIDPSFWINYLVKGAKFHEECLHYAEKLGKERSLLILSSLGLDEIWFALLGILTRIELRNRKLEEKRWFWFLKENPEFVSTLAGELEKKTTFLLEIPFLFLIEISHESTLKSLN